MIVLVAEDEPITSFVLAGELKRAGHSVLGPVTNTSDALQLVEECRPDVALIEIELDGDYAGIELARQLSTMGIPCVYASARSTLARENASSALGYLAKPYNPESIAEIFEIIKEAVSGAPLQQLRIPPALEIFGR